ncbi:carboxypeptidase-like regulatory domain-containing protein [Deminuibacter soli]|uniref:Carboxypeptidase-like regulatory domain-containing protein n=1 Tax=Deminuibacter soli TaxID=2291815 RepID=A0A3E1NLU1_9BACT|nr:carboxypeptidase-like regulatory domain-containing protein [Deminuibacter soli]RFM28814.1 carboxypeptidase-like regulatory domain-containing protein [Deminuibacter soli]
MKKILQYAFCLLLTGCFIVKTQAQQVIPKDSVIQLFGVVMTADSLRAIPAASILVQGAGRGTLTNDQGVFSIAVLQGQKIRFSCVGFKDVVINIPDKVVDNQYYVIQLLVSDTAYLPATILKPRPSREQFERDFANTRIPNDQYEIARQNIDEAKRRVLLATLPADGREAVNAQLRQQASKLYYQGQQPPINILNPAAWSEFIKAWKRGDFKSKNDD